MWIWKLIWDKTSANANINSQSWKSLRNLQVLTQMNGSIVPVFSALKKSTWNQKWLLPISTGCPMLCIQFGLFRTPCQGHNWISHTVMLKTKKTMTNLTVTLIRRVSTAAVDYQQKFQDVSCTYKSASAKQCHVMAYITAYYILPQKLLEWIKTSGFDYFWLFMVQFGMLLKLLLTQESHNHKYT